MNEEARARPRPSPPPPPAPPQVSAAARGAPCRAVGAAPAARPSAGGAAAPRVGAHDAIGGRPRPAPLLPPGEVTAWRGRAPRAGGGGARPGGPPGCGPRGAAGEGQEPPRGSGRRGGRGGGENGRGGGADVSAEGRPRNAVPGAAEPRRNAAVAAPRGRAPNASRSEKFALGVVHLYSGRRSRGCSASRQRWPGVVAARFGGCPERVRCWRCRAAFRQERARAAGAPREGQRRPAAGCGSSDGAAVQPKASCGATNQPDLFNKLKLFFSFCQGRRLEISNLGKKAKLIKGLMCLRLQIPRELWPAEPPSATIVCTGWWVAAGGCSGTGQLWPLEQQQC